MWEGVDVEGRIKTVGTEGAMRFQDSKIERDLWIAKVICVHVQA